MNIDERWWIDHVSMCTWMCTSLQSGGISTCTCMYIECTFIIEIDVWHRFSSCCWWKSIVDRSSVINMQVKSMYQLSLAYIWEIGYLQGDDDHRSIIILHQISQDSSSWCKDDAGFYHRFYESLVDHCRNRCTSHQISLAIDQDSSMYDQDSSIHASKP